MKQQPKKRLAHLFDASRCVGCGACAVACTSTNAPEMMLREDKGWNWMGSNIRQERLETRERPQILLVQCQHCENAPCVNTCPFGACFHDPETGLVKLDEKRCIGCKYCVASCPYNVRWSHPDTGLPMKCMGKGCEELVAAGGQPACVSACPAGARAFGDLNDPGSELSRKVAGNRTIRLLEAKGTKPKYFVVV